MTCHEQGDAVKPDHGYDNRCCHKTRLFGAPCPVGRACPYDEEGPKTAQQPVLTPVEPTPRDFLSDWKVI